MPPLQLQYFQSGSNPHHTILIPTIMSRMFTSTIRCFDCNTEVLDIKKHRSAGECPKPKGGAPAGWSGKVGGHTAKPLNQLGVRQQGRDYFFLLDLSSSMVGPKLTEVKRTVLEMHTNKLRDEDRMAIVTFDSAAFFRLKPRPNGQLQRQGEIAPALERFFAKGNTALYDAIWLALEEVRDKSRPTTLIVLTDGEDNASAHTLQQVLDEADKYPAIVIDIVHIDGQTARPVEAFQKIAASRQGHYKIVTTVTIVETVRELLG